MRELHVKEKYVFCNRTYISVVCDMVNRKTFGLEVFLKEGNGLKNRKMAKL